MSQVIKAGTHNLRDTTNGIRVLNPAAVSMGCHNIATGQDRRQRSGDSNLAFLAARATLLTI